MAVPEETFSMVGSYGDEVGQLWSLGPFTSSFNLLTIRVWFGSAGIYGLQFQYELNSEKHWSPIYGQNVLDIGHSDQVLLDTKSLTQITVSTGDTPAIVKSLAFLSDKDIFGPYGKETINKKDMLVQGSIAGFYGAAGDHLLAFGIYEKKDMN